MNIVINAFVIILILIVTLCTATVKPKMHKHFILTSQNFKLTNDFYNPKDMQSVSLFKIGETKVSSPISVQKVTEEQNTYYQNRETKIIPSSFFSSSESANARTTYSSDTNQTERNQSQISSDNAKLWADLEKKTHADRDKYASKSSNSSSNIDSKSSGKNTQSNYGSEDLSCPICEGLHDFENATYKDAKYRDETIAWNKWRSNLQNRIMDDSDIDADYGTIFYFSFTVDNNRNISNVRVISTNLWDKESTEVVRRAILHLKGKPILNFPPNTNRSSIKFTGGFVIGTTSQYSTPGDYNDFEHVRLQY